MNDENDPSYFNTLEYEEEYCDRINVGLRVSSGRMTPSEVTGLLDVEPTEYATVGEEQRDPETGLVRVGKANAWFLSSETCVHSTDVNRHIDWLTERLKPCSEALGQLQKTAGVRMGVDCIWWVFLDGGGPVLRPRQMRDLASLNLECAFDFQYHGPKVPGRLPGTLQGD